MSADQFTVDQVRQISKALLEALIEFRRVLAVPPVSDQEIQDYLICTPENGEYSGGVWCADGNCPLQAEGSEIGDFQEGTFTLAELHDAIGRHIAHRRESEDGPSPSHWDCGCLVNEVQAHRVGCPDHPWGHRG